MEKENFYTLYQEHKKSLYFTALVILGNTHDAEEAIQESFIDAYKGLKKLRNKKYAKTWLTRILINRCKKIIKARKKHILLTSIEIDNLNFREPISLGEMVLVDSLNKLNENERMLIMLRFFNDLPIKEISTLLNTPIGTIKSKLHRIIKKLKSDLKDEVLLDE